MTASFANVALVALGGALGSVLRALLTWGVAARLDGATMPATLAANVLGSFVLGLVVAVTGSGAVAWRVFVVTGVCGGFTTFSTFSFEAVSAVEEGRVGLALGYAGGSLMLGGVALWGGLVVGRALVAR